MSKRPPPIHDGPLRAHARRKPTPSDPSRWYWQVVYNEGGKQHTVPNASGRYTVVEARGLLRVLLKQGGWQAPEPEPETPAQTVELLLGHYVKDAERRVERGRLRPATALQYKRIKEQLRPMWAWPLSAPPALSVAQDTIDGLAEGYAPRTVQLAWRVLSAAWRWGQARHVVALSPLPPVELPATDGYTRTRTTPSDDSARSVVAAMPDDWRRVCGEILLGTGARIGEVATLDWADWEPTDTGGILYVDGKTGRRAIYVGRNLADRLAVWWARQGEPVSGWLLGCLPSTVRRRIRYALADACELLEVERVTPHSLRRLASTRALAAGLDPATYVAQFGHSYTQGLRDYAQTVKANRERAANILDRPAVEGEAAVISLEQVRRRREG